MSERELTPGQRRRALAELARRRQGKRAVDFAKLCSGPQLRFVEDAAPLVAACCSRRAGKTWGIAIRLFKGAAKHPFSTNLYLTNTRPQAKRNIWGVLQRLNDQLAIGAKFNAVELSCTLPNGGQIILGGCNDELEVERYRGPAYPTVVIDEAQSIRSFFEYMVEDILEPATLDYRGQIFITGTPNASCAGFFHDVMKRRKRGWSLHHWTLLENPHLQDPAGWLRERRERKGITEDDPKYRREYRGEWVRDSASQAYQITDRNLIDAFPVSLANDWEYVLGIDLGFVGVSAFVVLAYSVALNLIVAVESYQVTPAHFGPDEVLLTPEHLAKEIAKLRRRYDFASIVVDPGGLGAKFIDEIRRRFSIHAHAAEKAAKMGAIELLNGDLRAEPPRVLLVRDANRDLIHDASVLELDWERIDKGKHGGLVSRADLVIDDRNPDHLTDAFTYAYRRCRAYLHDDAENEGPPAHGTDARDEWEERERERREMEAAAEADERPWWAQATGDTL